MSEGSGSQRFCSTCGAEVKAGIKYCLSCARPVESSRNPFIYRIESPEEKRVRDEARERKEAYKKQQRRRPWETEADQDVREAQNAVTLRGCSILVGLFIIALAFISAVVNRPPENTTTPAEKERIAQEQEENNQRLQRRIELDWGNVLSSGETFTIEPQGALSTNEQIVLAKYGYECEIINGVDYGQADSIYECSR